MNIAGNTPFDRSEMIKPHASETFSDDTTGHPSIYNFDNITPVTMTTLVGYDASEINLPALFSLLPVTERELPSGMTFQKKQNKIKFPKEMNHPGEILSMRFDGMVRGIVRSAKAASFSHSIIIDIGTSSRIISVKLSKSTLQLTGPTSYAISQEAAEYILEHVRKCQEDLDFVRANRESAEKVRDIVVDELTTGVKSTCELSPIELQIYTYFYSRVKKYTPLLAQQFVAFILALKTDLYTGTLELGSHECEMANILFNLGYKINQVKFAQIMNAKPFMCKYNNANRASSVIVKYRYIKLDRTTKQPVEAFHTLRINKSGHVKHYGPGLKLMRPVYYAFMRQTLLHVNEIRSAENGKRELKITVPSRPWSVDEWNKFLKNEKELYESIIAGTCEYLKDIDYNEACLANMSPSKTSTSSGADSDDDFEDDISPE